jgi:hypothetical protein
LTGLIEADWRIDEAPMPARVPLRGTPQQEAFWGEMLHGDGHAVLEARAGTGKSSSCREAMWRLIEAGGSPSIRYCCFNKAIADEFERGCPPGVEVGTMHRFGLKALRRAFPAIQVDSEKTYKLLDSEPGGTDLKRYVRRSIAKLVGLAKNTAVRPGAPGLAAALADLVVFYDVQCWGAEDRVIAWAARVLSASAASAASCDFDDMLWMPLVLGLAFPKVDFLFIDECLPGWTPVLLADGTSKTIEEIVDGQLAVDVLAYDAEEGVQKPCRVTGWSRTLNRKPLVKIKARWTRKKGTNYPTNFIVCTIDHRVWANGEWIPAGEVRPGMVVQVETSAEKSQAGKITARGREVLAESVSARNEAGGMGGAREGSPGPPIRGGNGAGPTLAQSVLHEALGAGWTMEHIVTTYPATWTSGLPYHYKIDIANVDEMIAVEVDGESHRGARRDQDRRKDEFLRSRGWKVVRVPNRDAIQKTEAVAARILESECPIGAEVVSVEPVEIPDNYVYDLTVEGCHDFYANGILVHNCQDLNPVQHELADRLNPHGRTIAVGDSFQSIYAFRGADIQSMSRLRDALDARTLPLTVTWRCPASHVELARELVPDLEASPTARQGTILRTIDVDAAIDAAAPGDLVLCRANAPLVRSCLKLIGRRRRATMRGRAFGDSLQAIARDVSGDTIEDFQRLLLAWEAKEIARLDRRDGTEHLIEATRDKAGALGAIAETCGSPAEVPGVIATLFDDGPPEGRVTFSSVHRAKGSEAGTVLLIDLPYPARTRDGRPVPPAELGQRRNLSYVARTRSKDTLVLITP